MKNRDWLSNIVGASLKWISILGFIALLAFLGLKSFQAQLSTTPKVIPTQMNRPQLIPEKEQKTPQVLIIPLPENTLEQSAETFTGTERTWWKVIAFQEANPDIATFRQFNPLTGSWFDLIKKGSCRDNNLKNPSASELTTYTLKNGIFQPVFAPASGGSYQTFQEITDGNSK
jgi:hypothetical protein